MERIETGGCKTCGKPISKVNRTGWCRQHYAAANNGGDKWIVDNRARWADPVMRARIVIGLRSRSAQRIAWCPLEYRQEYHRLKRVKHCSAAEARAMIEDMMAADMRRHVRTGALPQQERLAA